MTCLPEPGGCERSRTDAFVAYLNQLEGSRFTLRASLDRLHRNSPRPEALYSDSGNGAELVIECKSVVWPRDYAARHRNDHIIADALTKELRKLADALPLSIDLELAPRMSRDELLAFAREVSDAVRSGINSVLAGRAIGSRKGGRPWTCFLDPEDRDPDFDDPATGLIVRWTQPGIVSPENLPGKLACEIQRLFHATVAKFCSYPKARGILLLDPYGSIRYTGDWWWARALKTVPVPAEIAEVWLARFDWVTDFEEGWMFERLHSRRSHRRAA